MTPDQFATAACRGKTSLYYPPAPPAHGWDRPAKAICATCPHTGPDGPCVADDPDLTDPAVRGGLNPTERATLAITTDLARTCRWCRRAITDPARKAFCCDDHQRAWHNANKRRQRAA